MNTTKRIPGPSTVPNDSNEWIFPVIRPPAILLSGNKKAAPFNTMNETAQTNGLTYVCGSTAVVRVYSSVAATAWSCYYHTMKLNDCQAKSESSLGIFFFNTIFCVWLYLFAQYIVIWNNWIEITLLLQIDKITRRYLLASYIDITVKPNIPLTLSAWIYIKNIFVVICKRIMHF